MSITTPTYFLCLLACCCRNRLHKCSRMLVLSRWRSTTCLAVWLPSTPALNYPPRRDLVLDKYMYSASTHQCFSLVEDDCLFLYLNMFCPSSWLHATQTNQKIPEYFDLYSSWSHHSPRSYMMTTAPQIDPLLLIIIPIPWRYVCNRETTHVMTYDVESIDNDSQRNLSSLCRFAKIYPTSLSVDIECKKTWKEGGQTLCCLLVHAVVVSDVHADTKRGTWPCAG